MSKRKFLTIVGSLIAVSAILLSTERYFYRKNWERETSPLSNETKAMLCKSLHVDNRESVCDPSKIVYAYDFSRILEEYFSLPDSMETPKDQATITFQEVERVLGDYQIECQDVVDLPVNGYSYFRCIYDLQGDSYWVNAFYFYYPEETLFSIRSGSSSND